MKKLWPTEDASSIVEQEPNPPPSPSNARSETGKGAVVKRGRGRPCKPKTQTTTRVTSLVEQMKTVLSNSRITAVQSLGLKEINIHSVFYDLVLAVFSLAESSAREKNNYIKEIESARNRADCPKKASNVLKTCLNEERRAWMYDLASPYDVNAVIRVRSIQSIDVGRDGRVKDRGDTFKNNPLLDEAAAEDKEKEKKKKDNRAEKEQEEEAEEEEEEEKEQEEKEEEEKEGTNQNKRKRNDASVDADQGDDFVASYLKMARISTSEQETTAERGQGETQGVYREVVPMPAQRLINWRQRMYSIPQGLQQKVLEHCILHLDPTDEEDIEESISDYVPPNAELRKELIPNLYKKLFVSNLNRPVSQPPARPSVQSTLGMYRTSSANPVLSKDKCRRKPVLDEKGEVIEFDQSDKKIKEKVKELWTRQAVVKKTPTYCEFGLTCHACIKRYSNYQQSMKKTKQEVIESIMDKNEFHKDMEFFAKVKELGKDNIEEFIANIATFLFLLMNSHHVDGWIVEVLGGPPQCKENDASNTLVCHLSSNFQCLLCTCMDPKNEESLIMTVLEQLVDDVHCRNENQYGFPQNVFTQAVFEDTQLMDKLEKYKEVVHHVHYGGSNYFHKVVTWYLEGLIKSGIQEPYTMPTSSPRKCCENGACKLMEHDLVTNVLASLKKEESITYAQIDLPKKFNLTIEGSLSEFCGIPQDKRAVDGNGGNSSGTARTSTGSAGE